MAKVTIRTRSDRDGRPAVYWWENGKERSRLFPKMHEAKMFQAVKYEELNSGRINPNAPRNINVKWDMLVELYLESVRANKCKDTTLTEIKRSIDYFARIVGELKSQEINQFIIDHFKNKRSVEKKIPQYDPKKKEDKDGNPIIRPEQPVISTASLNKDLRHLRAFIRWMQDREYNNAKIKVKLAKEKKVEIHVLSAEEVEKLKAAMQPYPDMLCKTIIMLGTARRLGAIERLKITNIDYGNRTIKFNEKGQREHTVPMNKEVESTLTKYQSNLPDGRIWLFHDTNPDDKKTGTLFNRNLWDEITMKAGIDVTPHDLRRTALTKLAESGLPPKTVQAISGHASLTTLMQYYINAENKKMMQSAVDVLDGSK